MRTVLITGATGGIGRALADALADEGHSLVLTGRDQAHLYEIASVLGDETASKAADLTTADGRDAIERICRETGVDTVINNAGTNELTRVDQMDEREIEAMITANVTAPLTLTRALLPHLQRQPGARILNIGSTFGAIGFPGYAVYSATKFALRGFSEALRRELAGDDVGITYIAPRATRTRLSAGRADALNRELGNAVDEPEVVARAIVHLLERAPGDYYLGLPEKLFARINMIAPRLVTRSLRRRLDTIRRHADRDREAEAPIIKP